MASKESTYKEIINLILEVRQQMQDGFDSLRNDTAGKIKNGLNEVRDEMQTGLAVVRDEMQNIEYRINRRIDGVVERIDQLDNKVDRYHLSLIHDNKLFVANLNRHDRQITALKKYHASGAAP